MKSEYAAGITREGLGNKGAKSADFSHYEKVQELENILPYDIINIPAEEIDLSNFEFSKDYTGSSPTEALSYIKNAEFSVKPLFQDTVIFYSQSGKTYVDIKSCGIIKSFPRSYFEADENKAMRVVE